MIALFKKLLWRVSLPNRVRVKGADLASANYAEWSAKTQPIAPNPNK